MRILDFLPILRESFTDISVEKLGIADMVKQADSRLSDEAADAIDGFVGVPHDAMQKQIGYGIMHSKPLEDAYGAIPSDRGKKIKHQLDQAFAPIKAVLKNKFGNVITLYRGTNPSDGTQSARHTLSWTSDPRVAALFVGIDPRMMKIKPITDADIQKALSTYHNTGRVKWRQNTYVRTDTPTNGAGVDEFYYDIYDRNNELVTDGDDIAQQFKDDQEYYQELIDKRNKKLKRVVKKQIPIDDIIWITDRAGQSEFILHNRPGSSGYIAPATK